MVRCVGVCLCLDLAALYSCHPRCRGWRNRSDPDSCLRMPLRDARALCFSDFLHIYSVVASHLEHYLQRYLRGAQQPTPIPFNCCRKRKASYAAFSPLFECHAPWPPISCLLLHTDTDTGAITHRDLLPPPPLLACSTHLLPLMQTPPISCLLLLLLPPPPFPGCLRLRCGQAPCIRSIAPHLFSHILHVPEGCINKVLGKTL